MTLLYLGGDEHVIVTKILESTDPGVGPLIEEVSRSDVGQLPSFLAFSRKGTVGLCIAEAGETLSSLRVADDGGLEILSQVPCPGGPAYVSFDSTEHFALVASYGSGQTHLFELSPDGKLSSNRQTWDTGKFSHCAMSTPDGSRILTASKGTDTIAISHFSPDRGTLSPTTPLEAPRGSGPRHLAFSADGARAYLACENDCSLIVYDAKDGNLTPLCHLPSLPDGAREGDTGADVHVSRDGHFIYMSNRGTDSISVFQKTETGAELIQNEPTRGRVPRNFCLLGEEQLIAANQESKSLSFFHRDSNSGRLRFAGQVETAERPFWVGNTVSY